MARPRIELNLRSIEVMASIGCTNIDIALIVGCSVDTIENRCSAVLAKGRANGREKLRRMQWKLAANGNATMLIWLGKQMLGQADQIKTENDNTTRVVIERMPPTVVDATREPV